jgi:hypothetical protein
MTKTQNKWAELRVNYYQNEKSALLAHAIQPAWQALRDAGCNSFWIERGWYEGPHISLFVLDANAASLDNAVTLIIHYVDNHPSMRAVSLDEQHKLHQNHAKWEAKVASFKAWQHDNKVTCQEHAPDFSFFPSQTSIELAVKSISKALPLVFDAINECLQNPAHQFRVGAAILLSYAQNLGPLERSYFFMRAYVEKVLNITSDNPEMASQRLSLVYQQKKNEVHQLVDSLIKSQQPNRKIWHEFTRDLFRLAQEAVEQDALVFGNAKAAESYEQAGWKSEEFEAKSEFTRSLVNADWLWQKIEGNSFYSAHMFTVNRLYSILSLIGINAKDKLLLLDLLARNIEERFSIDPLEQLNQEG